MEKCSEEIIKMITPKERCAISVESTIQYMVRNVGLTRDEAINLVKEIINEY